jgi:hypothetical protein
VGDCHYRLAAPGAIFAAVKTFSLQRVRDIASDADWCQDVRLISTATAGTQTTG